MTMIVVSNMYLSHTSPCQLEHCYRDKPTNHLQHEVFLLVQYSVSFPSSKYFRSAYRKFEKIQVA